MKWDNAHQSDDLYMTSSDSDLRTATAANSWQWKCWLAHTLHYYCCITWPSCLSNF